MICVCMRVCASAYAYLRYLRVCACVCMCAHACFCVVKQLRAPLNAQCASIEEGPNYCEQFENSGNVFSTRGLLLMCACVWM